MKNYKRYNNLTSIPLGSEVCKTTPNMAREENGLSAIDKYILLSRNQELFNKPKD